MSTDDIDWTQQKPNLEAYNKARYGERMRTDNRPRRERREQFPKTHPVSPKPRHHRHRANIVVMHDDLAKKAKVRALKKQK